MLLFSFLSVSGHKSNWVLTWAQASAPLTNTWTLIGMQTRGWMATGQLLFGWGLCVLHMRNTMIFLWLPSSAIGASTRWAVRWSRHFTRQFAFQPVPLVMSCTQRLILATEMIFLWGMSWLILRDRGRSSNMTCWRDSILWQAWDTLVSLRRVWGVGPSGGLCAGPERC